jgi:hypothetical protein
MFGRHEEHLRRQKRAKQFANAIAWVIFLVIVTVAYYIENN